MLRELKEMFRHFGLSNSPKHRRDLHREFNKKNRKCYCLRGGLKLANCFGSWDQLALEVPQGNINPNHICDRSFLLNDLKQLTNRRTLPSIAKHTNRKSDGTLSLGYLSRSTADKSANDRHLRFHHFESVEEHIKYYRENKPNSLHSPSHKQTSQPEQGGEAEERTLQVDPERCSYCTTLPVAKDASTPVDSQGDTPTRSQDKTTSSYHHHSCTPLRALGKAIVPSYASLIMRLPSLEASSDSYWVPVNAVFQKRVANAAMYHSFGYYDNNTSDSQGEFPSLRKKQHTRHSFAFPPSKKRSFVKRTGVREDKIEEEEEEEEDTCQSSIRGDVSITHIPNSSTTTTRCFAGQGRLLSGQLKSSSVHPIHPDNLQDLVIGIQKSPYERLMPKLSSSFRTKKSTKKIHSKSSSEVEENSDNIHRAVSGNESKVCGSDTKSSDVVDQTTTTCTSANSSSHNEEGLTLNKLDITCESSEVEGFVAEASVINAPQLEMKPVSATNEPSKGTQEKLYKPKNVAITFTKPKKLFRLTSTHAKLLQQTRPPKQQQDSVKNKKEPQFTAQRGEYYSSQDAKHRLILNKEEGSKVQSVFGIQNHPATRCVLRSRERRKLKLEGKGFEKKDVIAVNRKKVQVYLIKTMENILPELISENYSFESSKAINLYDELLTSDGNTIGV